ncbi:MAG: hypothetical protein Kow0077_00880 [Anaerolineae bacterium]
MINRRTFHLLLGLGWLVSTLIGNGYRAQAQSGGQGDWTLVEEARLSRDLRAVAEAPDGTLVVARGEDVMLLDGDGQLRTGVRPGRGMIHAVALRGVYAYVLAEGGLSILTLPDLQEEAFYPGGGQALQVGGRAVYVAARESGLRVGVTDRRGLPEQWQVVTVPGGALDLALDAGDRFLYVLTGARAVNIYAITAETPALVGALETDEGADLVRVRGSRLLIGSGPRLHIYDLAEPGAPRFVTQYDPLHEPGDVLVRHDRAYVADRAGGLRRFTIGRLDAPQPDAGALWPGQVYGLAMDARYLYAAAGWEGVLAFDVGRLGDVALRRQLALPGEVTSLAIDSGESRWMLAGMGADGLAVIDWANVDSPRLLRVVPMESPVRAVTIRENLGVVGLESGDLAFYSFADRDNPRLLSTVRLKSAPRAFAWDGTLLFVAAGDAGLVIVETLRPAAPERVGQLPPLRPDQPVLDVTLEGGKRAYLSTQAALVIADVDLLAAPQVLSVVDVPAEAAIARNFIVYAAGGATFSTVNAASSNEPRVLGQYQGMARIRDVAGDGATLWLAGGPDGATLTRLDIEGRDPPREQTLQAGGPGFRGVVEVSGGHLVLPGADGTLWQLAGERLQALQPGLPAGGVLHAVDGQHVLVAGTEAFAVVEATQAEMRVVAGGRVTGTPLAAALADDGALYAALGERGVQALTPSGANRGQWLPEAADGATRSVAVRGAWLIAAQHGPGETGSVRILDTEALAEVGRIALPGPAEAVAVAGARGVVTYREAGSGQGGLAVVDLRAPTGGWVAEEAADLPAQSLAGLPGQPTVYALDGVTLSVLQAGAASETLSVVRSITLPQPASQLVPLGTRYLAALQPGEYVLLVDVSVPDVPRVVAALATEAVTVAGDDGVLFLGSLSRGLARVTLSTLVAIEGRVEVLSTRPVGRLSLLNGTLFAAGSQELAAYAVEQGEVRLLHHLPLNAAHVHDLDGIETRRGGYWLYLTLDERLVAVRFHPDTGFETLVELRAGMRDILAVSDQMLWVADERGQTHMLALDGPDALDWQITFPAGRGAAHAAVRLADGIALGTSTGIVTLHQADPEARPPVVIAQIDGLASVPHVLVYGTGEAVWLGSEAGDVWRVDVTPSGVPEIRAHVRLSAPIADLALAAHDVVAAAVGDCGVALLDAGTLAPAGGWRGGSVAGVATVGDRIAVWDGDTLHLMAMAPRTDDFQIALHPDDGAVLEAEAVTLRWGRDGDACDARMYRVWMGVEPDQLELVGETTNVVWTLDDLPAGESWWWRVETVLPTGEVEAGPIRHFSTAAAPVDLAPARPDTFLPRETASPTPATASGQDDSAAPARPSAGVALPSNLGGLLVAGLVLEVLLVGGLVALWRARRRGKRG